MVSMAFRMKDLPEFVAQSDRLGGPGSPECERYWAGIAYQPDFIVDQTLDPFGDAYVEQQLALYREISGRDFDQISNEHTSLDIDKHVAAVNPYDHGFPGGLALHVERLSRAIRLGAPPRGSRFLDMGCGWGLSSEVAAYCGLEVTAVDVNPDFVELVRRRAALSGSHIKAVTGTFDTFESDDRYAMVLFYECFHHALRPWTVLERMVRHLLPNGHIVLAGEPINDHWWTHWGLRLDCLSVYCIHKFGWLESGWSAEFLMAAFARAGLSCEIVGELSGEVGPVVIGRRTQIERVGADQIGKSWHHRGWFAEPQYLAGRGSSELVVPAVPVNSRAVILGLWNFRGKPIHVIISDDNGIIIARDLPPGRTDVEIAKDRLRTKLRFLSETWVPAHEIANQDEREIGIHLEDVSFI